MVNPEGSGSFVSPLANADFATKFTSDPAGLLLNAYNGINGWTAVVTLFLMLVAYDQGK